MSTLAKEVWLPIAQVEGYFISSLGRVKSEDHYVTATTRSGNPGQRLIKGQSRNTSNDKKGYVVLRVGKNPRKSFKVHRLVALAHLAPPDQDLIDSITNPQNGVEVNHIDGDKTNNSVDNLEWCNGSENTQHAHDIGLQPSKKGSGNGRSKLTESQVVNLKFDRQEGLLYRQLAERYNISTGLVGHILNGRNWKHV